MSIFGRRGLFLNDTAMSVWSKGIAAAVLLRCWRYPFRRSLTWAFSPDAFDDNIIAWPVPGTHLRKGLGFRIYTSDSQTWWSSTDSQAPTRRGISKALYIPVLILSRH